ncbi:MAG TPA: XRE family transcriptional regulator [Polyangiaceae bacterium]|jgi:transcriptional regulator with XRE-family HTH domain|nr:XRE family transcriptional regulator [Polyangiaceae bacterium]
MAKRSPSALREKVSTAEAEAMPEVGPNLRRLRMERGLSLEKLAQTAGVSRAMLGQIELGQSTPTIKTLWKISRALDVPFSALISGKPSGGTMVLKAKQTRRLSNHDGTFVSRALFPLGGPRRVEFYELRLAGRAEERAVPHPAGTLENLVVNRGSIEIEVLGERHSLTTGDVILFEADTPHAYRNLTNQEAVLYLVMIYAQSAP